MMDFVYAHNTAIGFLLLFVSLVSLVTVLAGEHETKPAIGLYCAFFVFLVAGILLVGR
ncbi:hypothetical protein [Enterobacter cloacae]|uniref:hypothetical protein n=1 Tax=Enterobacter cloacae TaxID=550 RepID=UPI003905C3DE